MRRIEREGARLSRLTFTRLATNVGTPERCNRDASKDVVEAFLGNLVPALQTAEEKSVAFALPGFLVLV